MRITNASDDAAGLAIASTLDVRTRVLNQAKRNISDGLSFLAIAEGSLNQLSEVLTRQKELAEQSANGVYSTTQRRALQNESDALVKEYNRILSTTEFNGISIFNPDSPELSIQTGVGAGALLTFDVGADVERNVDTGVGTAVTVTAGGNIYQTTVGDFDGDGDLDFATSNNSSASASIFINNGDGSFLAPVQYTTGTGPRGISASDMNGDGKLDLVVADNTGGSFSVLLGNGNGTFQARTSYAVTSPGELVTVDVNGDGFLDVVTGTVGANSFVSVSLNRGNGTFSAATSALTGLTPTFLAAGDVNGDGRADLLTANYSSNSVSVLLGTGNGTFTQGASYSLGGGSLPTEVVLVDFNRDGNLDFAASEGGSSQITIRFGQGDGTFNGEVTLTTSAGNLTIASYDQNGDGYEDLFVGQAASNNTFYGNGDGSFLAPRNGATGFFDLQGADLNADGVPDNILTGITATGIVIIRSADQVASMTPLYLLTQAGARDALSQINDIHQNVLSELANIGAAQSRLQSSFQHVQTTAENYDAARSRILDADIASESASLIRHNILLQAAAALLGQANQESTLVLKLL